jgi:hypothetical protein
MPVLALGLVDGDARSGSTAQAHAYRDDSEVSINSYAPPGLIERQLTGTVGELLIDRSGAFEGFVLYMTRAIRPFMTRESGIRRMVLRAYNEGLPLSVYFDGARDRIYKIQLLA